MSLVHKSVSSGETPLVNQMTNVKETAFDHRRPLLG